MKILGRSVVWVALIMVAAVTLKPMLERATYPIFYAPEVSNASDQWHVSRNLILAVMREESRFDPNSTSKVSAQGLMQLLPSTSQWIAQQRGLAYDPTKIRDPQQNIDFGVWYLAYLQSQFHDNTLAIEAYNAGSTNVKEWQKKTPGQVQFAETDAFVRRVQNTKSAYDRLYGEQWERK